MTLFFDLPIDWPGVGECAAHVPGAPVQPLQAVSLLLPLLLRACRGRGAVLLEKGDFRLGLKTLLE